jgi:DDE family transposase
MARKKENLPAAGQSRTTVERKSDRELVTTWTFNGPARLVFEAWTTPELLKRLWAPKSVGVSLRSCEADVHGRDVEWDARDLRAAGRGSRYTRRDVARIEATEQGLDIRYVVTSLRIGPAEWIYDSLYCARGQAENLIKLHKSQLASDRTSCRSALANQVRLVLHTAAYWLVLTVRDAIPKPRDLATAEFTTIRLRLLKIAARVIETAGRVRLAFAAACPEADLFREVQI